jgi:hypothetical protein
MADVVGKYGFQHGSHLPKEPVVLFEFNLSDLYFLESKIPEKDTFHKELFDAITTLESEIMKRRDRKRGYH